MQTKRADPLNSMRRTLLERFAVLVVVAFAIATPPTFYTAFRAIQTKANTVNDWLPKSYTETGDLKWFREHFVADQFVIVSWEGCRLGDNPKQQDAQPDDPRIERLAQMLVPPNDIRRDSDPGPTPLDGWKQEAPGRTGDFSHYFASVTTGRRLLNQLTSKKSDVPYFEAVDRLTGSLIGPDGHQTCIVVTLTDEAVDNLRGTIGRANQGWLQIRHSNGVLFQALEACEIDLESVRIGGPPVDSVAIDEEGERTLYRLASLAALVGMLLAWWSLRSIKLTLIVFACGVLSAITSLSVVYLSGNTTDAFLLSMPSLVYVLAVSGAVHLIKYYRDSAEEQGIEGAPAKAIQLGWKPTLLCSVTTAIGLLSLYTSDLTPIRKFGMFSSVGVMLMLIMLFVFLPATLYVWPIRVSKKLGDSDLAEPKRKSSFLSLDEFWQRFGGWVIRHYLWVTIACTVLIVGVGSGVTRVRTNIDLMKLFHGEARIRQDYQWLEANVGRLVPMEIVLKFNPDTIRRGDGTPLDQQRYSLLERVETVAMIEKTIESRFGPTGEDVVGQSLSPVTFVSPLPSRRRDFRTSLRRSAINTRLEQSYNSLGNSGYLTTDARDGSELWRISVRVAAFKDVDYGEFTDRLQSVVDPVIEQYNSAIAEGVLNSQNGSNEHETGKAISAIYTGVVPIVYKAQRALLDSLIKSTFWSFFTITPLLMFVSRGVLAGLVAMLPNWLPVLVVFGGMGWLGFPVAIGSMMSASIALGVAVDDTIHFLMWFRVELDKTGDRRLASLAAYRRCASPTLQAALISGIGLSLFAFSTFTPTKQFGLLMLTILLTGVVAELVMIPALLAGPLGHAFRPNRNRRSGSNDPARKSGDSSKTSQAPTEKRTA